MNVLSYSWHVIADNEIKQKTIFRYSFQPFSAIHKESLYTSLFIIKYSKKNKYSCYQGVMGSNYGWWILQGFNWHPKQNL